MLNGHLHTFLEDERLDGAFLLKVRFSYIFCSVWKTVSQNV